MLLIASLSVVIGAFLFNGIVSAADILRPRAAGERIGQESFKEMAIGRLLSLLKLEDSRNIQGAEYLERTKDGELTVQRIRIPGYRGFPGIPSEGLELLKHVLLNPQIHDITELDLLYNERGYLIAIFPVIPSDTRVKIGSYLYAKLQEEITFVDLSPYYFAMPRINDPEAENKWLEFVQQLKIDEELIAKYKASGSYPFEILKDPMGTPYICVGINKNTGEWHANELLGIHWDGNRSPKVIFRNQRLAELQNPEEYQAVFTVLQTVYNPALLKSDRGFHRLIYRESGIRKGDIVLDVCSGIGVSAWLDWLLTRKKVYAIELNPIACVNIEENASRVGFEIEVRRGDSIIDENGVPRFDIFFDCVTTNGPEFVFSNPENPREEMPGSLEDLWDDDYMGDKFLRRYARGLPVVGRRYILWNARPHDYMYGTTRNLIDTIRDEAGATHNLDIRTERIGEGHYVYFITPHEKTAPATSQPVAEPTEPSRLFQDSVLRPKATGERHDLALLRSSGISSAGRTSERQAWARPRGNPRHTRGTTALTAVWAARPLSPNLRPLAKAEKTPKHRALILLEVLRREFASSLKYQTDTIYIAFLRQRVSSQASPDDAANRKMWTGLELQRLKLYSRKTFNRLGGVIAPEDQQKFLDLIDQKLFNPLLKAHLRELSYIYDHEILPAIDRLIFQYMASSLSAAVDSRNRAEAQSLVDQMNALGEGAMAILVDCPTILDYQKDGEPIYDERFAIGSAKITVLNEDMEKILKQSNLVNEGSVILASTWMMQEFPINMLKHARDNLPADNKGVPAFGVVIVRIARERDGVRIEFTSQDNGGGSNIDDLFKAAKTASENLEKPTGRGLQVICGLVLDSPDVTDGSFTIISGYNGDAQNKLVFTGCVDGHKTTDTSTTKGLLTHISFKVNTVTPLEQMRAPEAAENSISSSILRPRAAGERENSKILLAEKILQWEEALQNKARLKAIIRQHNGRAAFYVHTGGGYVGEAEGWYKYVNNIRKALADETGVVFILGGEYTTLNDIETRAVIIDIPSIFNYPIPSIGVRVALDKIGSCQQPWDLLMKIMKELGVERLSPFGGEIATFENTGRVRVGYDDKLGCVGGAIYFLQGNFAIEVFPQLCSSFPNNKHLSADLPVTHGSYILGQYRLKVASPLEFFSRAGGNAMSSVLRPRAAGDRYYSGLVDSAWRALSRGPSAMSEVTPLLQSLEGQAGFATLLVRAEGDKKTAHLVSCARGRTFEAEFDRLCADIHRTNADEVAQERAIDAIDHLLGNIKYHSPGNYGLVLARECTGARGTVGLELYIMDGGPGFADRDGDGVPDVLASLEMHDDEESTLGWGLPYVKAASTVMEITSGGYIFDCKNGTFEQTGDNIPGAKIRAVIFKDRPSTNNLRSLLESI